MAHKIRHESPYGRRRAGAAAGVLLTVGMLGRLVHGEYSEFKENQAQPACDITATRSDTQRGTIDGIKAELDEAGDRGDAVLVFDGRDGHMRNPNDPRDAARYFVHGSKNLQPNDNVRVLHVDPNVCGAVGGIAVSNDAIDASMSYRQK